MCRVGLWASCVLADPPFELLELQRLPPGAGPVVRPELYKLVMLGLEQLARQTLVYVIAERLPLGKQAGLRTEVGLDQGDVRREVAAVRLFRCEQALGRNVGLDDLPYPVVQALELIPFGQPEQHTLARPTV